MHKVLKVKISQPHAHYRVPFSYQKRFTYPIPPFSTLKGLICNLIGIRDENDERLKKIKDGLSLAVYGKYESITKEYTWFRNLDKDSHVARFATIENRFIDGVPQHPGGQMPVSADVLQNVYLTIYIYHGSPDFLEEIKNAFTNPSDRLSVIHLGRSEDWLVFEMIDFVDLKQLPVRSIDYLTWIPDKSFAHEYFICEDYEKFFNEFNGNLFRLPTFYKITKDNKRIFTDYLTVKLYEGGSFKKRNFYVDENENLPIILTRLRGNKDAGDSSEE